MKKVKIKLEDKIQNNDLSFLDFDLSELLSSIEKVCKKYRWYLHHFDFIDFKIPNENVTEILIKVKEHPPLEVIWEKLILLSEVVLQTENMLLTGRSNNIFVNIEAVDTSFWEVETNNPEIIKCLQKNFKNIAIVN